MNFKKLFRFIIIIFIVGGLFSCTPQKRLRYLQDKGSTSDTGKSVNQSFEYKIKPQDILFVRVISIDEKTNNFMNSETSNNFYEQNSYLNNFTVSDSGYVDIPLVGNVFVKDLTLFQIKEKVQSKVDLYLKGATVIVKLLNFKVTVLGEVNHPGTFRVYENKVNVLEAIGLAGDLTTYGNRQKIMIIRQNENNKVLFVDITDRKIIYSSQFYLLPNDIIYVDAMKAKSYGFNIFPFATILSGITTLILLLNYLKI